MLSVHSLICANVKAMFKCSQEDKERLQGSQCVLGISVGQPYHEGDKFAATIDLVNKTFSRCTIVVCDTLQRHTLQMDNLAMAERVAHLHALRLGDEWINRNKAIYASLKMNFKLIR